MEERGKKGNQVLLTVIGVATLLIAMVGATFAFFTANSVTGNADTNNISAQTAQYGDTTVTYDETYGSINTGILDLTQTAADASTDGLSYEYLMKFKVATTSTTNRTILINWSNVTNTFCQYADGNACGTAGDTDVRDEAYYTLYLCNNETAYNGTTADTNAKTVTLDAGCTPISSSTSPENTLPATAENGNKVHTADTLGLNANSTNYYALVVTIRNEKAVQNYNQGKSFSGRVIVSIPVQ